MLVLPHMDHFVDQSGHGRLDRLDGEVAWMKPKLPDHLPIRRYEAMSMMITVMPIAGTNSHQTLV